MSEAGDKVRLIAKLIESNMKKRHFNNELGLEFEDFYDEYEALPKASFIYHKKDNHLNNYDALHGGIIASIFDVAMGIGCAALSNSMVTTTDMSMSFLRPARGDNFRIIVVAPLSYLPLLKTPWKMMCSVQRPWGTIFSWGYTLINQGK